MKMWVVFIILYVIFVSLYLSSKKKATEINSIYHVVFYISLIAFIFNSIISNNIFSITISSFFYLMIKSIIVVSAWYFGIYSISKLPLGIYGINAIIRVIFTIILSVLFLSEVLSFKILLGITIIIASLFFMNYISINEHKKKSVSFIALLALFIYSLLSSVSEIMDKVLMYDLTISQMMFWTLFFNTLFSGIIFFIKNKSFGIKLVKGNYWLIIAAFCLVIGDRFLFAANKDPDSVVSIMTVLKQLSTFVLILLGKLLYKEEKILLKVLCFIFIMMGLIIIFV